MNFLVIHRKRTVPFVYSGVHKRDGSAVYSLYGLLNSFNFASSASIRTKSLVM